MTKLCFVDSETLGLDAERHPIWELALIIRPDGGTREDDEEHVWQFPVFDALANAEPIALKINKFYERYKLELENPDALEHWKQTAWDIVKLTAGAHLVGAVPDFDEQRLKLWLRKHGVTPLWHYHLVCVENLMAGVLAAAPPWKSSELSENIGIDKSKYEEHTALGDARWARDIYDKVIGNNASK